MLRAAQLSDLDEILRIQKLCYQDIEPESPAAYINKLEQAPDCAFVIVDQHEILAYLFAMPIMLNEPPALDSADYRLPSQANCLYLHDLAIAPSGRGQGLSQPLLKVFFNCANTRKLSQSSLIAIQGSAPFWNRYGFVQTELSNSASIQNKLKSYGQAQYLINHALPH